MGFLDRFRKSHVDGRPETPEEDASDAGEGGLSFYASRLNDLRWISTGETVNIAKAGIDPISWPGHQMELPLESAMLHDHEQIREQLSSRVRAAVRDIASELWAAAASIAAGRDLLLSADEELVRVTNDWKRNYETLKSDPDELGRYYRARHPGYRQSKIAIAAGLVITEWAMTGYAVDSALRGLADIPLIGYLIAVGITLLFVVVPHSIGVQIREGRSHFHQWKLDYVREQSRVGRNLDDFPSIHELQRLDETEREQDRGFVLVAAIEGLFLLMLLIPLSFARAADADGSKWIWVPVFLALQLAVSGYFFMREYHDHGTLSHNLWHLSERRDQLVAERHSVLAGVAAEMSRFLGLAEHMVFTIQQAPHWDSEIVEAFLATAYYGRHAMMVEHPELAPFIQWAKLPLYHADEVERDGQPVLHNVIWRHPWLSDDGPFGRRWWMDVANQALGDLAEDGSSGARPAAEQREAESSWLVTSSPLKLLEAFLARFFGQPLEYRRPSILDEDLGDDETQLRLRPVDHDIEDAMHADLAASDARPPAEPAASPTQQVDTFVDQVGQAAKEAANGAESDGLIDLGDSHSPNGSTTAPGDGSGVGSERTDTQP
jgi:hypothetical protein